MVSARTSLLLATASLASAVSSAIAQDLPSGFSRRITIRGKSLEVATPAELKAKALEYEYPPAVENAALDYVDAMNALHDAMEHRFPRKAYYHVVRHGWIDLPDLVRWMDGQEEVYHSIGIGAEKLKSVFPLHNARCSFGIQFPHLNGLRELARFLVVRSKRNVHGGNYAQALGDLLLVFRIAAQNQRGPFLIDGLVNIAMRAIALTAIQDTVLRHEIPIDLLCKTAAHLARSQHALPKFSDGLKGERWLARDFMQIFVDSPQDAFTAAVGGELPASPLDLDGRRLRTAISQIVLPDRTIMQQIEQFYDRLEALSELPSAAAAKASRDGADERMLKDIPSWNVHARLLLPTLSRARQRYVYCDARTRLTRAVVRLKVFRITHGNWPDTLSQVRLLTERELSDPFTGEPFRYVKTAGAWTLYSVGPDLIDDRGHRSKDIPVRFPFPPPKPFSPNLRPARRPALRDTTGE